MKLITTVCNFFTNTPTKGHFGLFKCIRKIECEISITVLNILTYILNVLFTNIQYHSMLENSTVKQRITVSAFIVTHSTVHIQK